MFEPIAAKVFCDPRLRAVADRDHGDHRGHADDDAEHGEERAHLVAPQRAQRDPERLQEVHGAASSEPCGAGAASAAGRGARRSSERTRPSRMTTTRAAYAAMSARA